MTSPAPQQLAEQASVVLNGAGYGYVQLAPESFRTWTVTTINVRTSQGTTQTPVPQCTVYRGSLGGEIIAQTWMGNRATARGEEFIQPSQPVFVEWTNGVAGTTATAYLSGTIGMR